MSRASIGRCLFGLCAALLGACEPTPAHDGEPSAVRAAEVDGVRVVPVTGVRVPDDELVDQDGASVRLPALIGEGAVAVSFVFTTCTTICSPMTATFGRLQRELGASLDRDVRLVTISLDPATDTPERLRRYADRFERRAGWTFLTGRSEDVGRVLAALRGETGAKEGHSAVTLIGSAAEGRWTRVHGLASVDRLHEEIAAFLPASPEREPSP